MKVLITGANGYLGSYLYEKLKQEYDVIATSLHNNINNNVILLDICKSKVVKECFNYYKPDIIIHAAAISNVKLCEDNPINAYNVNTKGTLNIVKAANNISAKIIFISSFAAINPLNVYGKSKYEAEKYIKSTISGYEILRLSMTFGLSPNTTSHRPFNKIINTYKFGTPDIYDDTWKFQPTYIEDIFININKLIKNNFLDRILNIAMKESCTMYQLASDILPSQLIKGKKLYFNREEQYISNINLLNEGFIISTYTNMIQSLKKQLDEIS